MNMEQLKEFVCLENRKRDLDSELKATKQKLDDLEQVLVPQFIEDGVQRMTVDSRTVSLSQDIYASPENDREDVVTALKQSELGQYVAENYNSNSLTAFVREVAREVAAVAEREGRPYDEDDVRQALPKPLGDALKVSFVHNLRSRKSQQPTTRRTSMTQELVKISSPRALSVAPEEIAAMQEAFAMNIGNGSVSEFDLPRIKVNPGTALWLIPTLDGEETTQRIEGVVVFARNTRVYYQS